MPEVVCAGIIVADHISQPLDRLPEAGELMATDDPILTIGGCAANVACDLVRMGVEASVVGVVGDDGFGEFLVRELGERGVQTTGIRKSRQRGTSQTIILPVKGEDRRFIHSFGANVDLAVGDLSPLRLAGAGILYLGGYFLMPDLGQEHLWPVFRKAQSQGMKTVLDVGCPGPADYMSQLDRLLPFVDVFLPNDDESKLITGKDDPVEQAKVYRDVGARTVVVTCGGDGCVLASEEGMHRFGVYPADYLDGTGSGDAFDAGYIYGLLKDCGPLDCVRYASALGASCVRALGTTAGVFTRDECEAFMAEHELPAEQLE